MTEAAAEASDRRAVGGEEGAFPELGPVMRWPGVRAALASTPVSAVLCSGAEWSVGAGRRGAVRSVAERS